MTLAKNDPNPPHLEANTQYRTASYHDVVITQVRKWFDGQPAGTLNTRELNNQE
jgi:hypothetical protein